MTQTRKQRGVTHQRGGSNQRSVQETPILNNVLGITAAVGYNRNVLGIGSALSARSRSNNLTQTMKNKKFRNYFRGIQPKNWLEFAVQRQDDLAVKRLLEHPPPEFQKFVKNPAVYLKRRYWDKKTLIESVLSWVSTAEKLAGLYSKQSQEKMIRILLTLLKNGGSIEPHMIRSAWKLSPALTNKILEASPAFKEDSIAKGEQLLKDFRSDVNNLTDEIRRLTFEVRYGRGGRSDRQELEDYTKEKKHLEKSFANLEGFLRKERPELFMTGVILNNNNNYNNNYNYSINENNYGNAMRQMYANTNNNENNNYGNAMREMYGNNNNNA